MKAKICRIKFHEWSKHELLDQCEKHPCKYTSVARYASGLLMKMRVFIIKNDFIVFQSILQHDLYTLAWSQTTCLSTFSTPIATPTKHGFWTLQQYLLVTNIVEHAFFSWWAGIKRSYWVLRQSCTTEDLSIRRFSQSIIRWFQPMCENSHCHGEQWFVLSCSFLRRL